MTTLDALNAGLDMLNKPSEGVNMIYDALDKLQQPVSNGWTDKLDRLEKEFDRLIRALKAKDEKIALVTEALEVACGEVEALYKKLAHLTCPLCWLTDPPMNCNKDCSVCLQNYFMQKAQENIDRERNNEQVHDEIEGRKEMDVADQKKEMKHEA